MNTETQPQYDYNTPIEKTTTEMAIMAIKKIAEAAETVLVPKIEAQTIEEKNAEALAFVKLAMDIFTGISASDLPYDYASKPIAKLKELLGNLEYHINGSIDQAENELLSRTLGVRSPATNKFRKEMATIPTLMLELNKAREATGNDMNDFFNLPEEKTPAEIAPTPEEVQDGVPVDTEVESETVPSTETPA